MVQIVANLITMTLIAVYAFAGYKKPHGNMLRLVFLFFAVLAFARVIVPRPPINNEVLRYTAEGSAGLTTVLAAYIGGRLNKIEQNKILMTIVGILLTVSAVIVIANFPDFDVMRSIVNFTQPICWAALCLAYVARYEEHKAAGLEDK